MVNGGNRLNIQPKTPEMPNSDKPSKSALKRAHKAIQDFVQELLDTPDSILNQLPLSGYIVEEIQQARDMKMGARKRQVGFISKCMADEPIDIARVKLEQLRRPTARANDIFHRIEAMRDALIEGDDTVLESLVRDHGGDRRQLRSLASEARREAEREATPKSARKLFRIIRSLIGADDSGSS